MTLRRYVAQWEKKGHEIRVLTVSEKLKSLRTTAVRRTGVVSSILTAKVFFAVRTEGWVKNNLRSIHDCRSRGSLATFGAFAAVILYGGIMNPAAALMYNSKASTGKF